MRGKSRQKARSLLTAAILLTAPTACMKPNMSSELPPPQFGKPTAWTDTSCYVSQNNPGNAVDKASVITRDPRTPSDVGTVVFSFKENAGDILVTRHTTANDLLEVEDFRSFFNKYPVREASALAEAIVQWRRPAARACSVSDPT